MSSVSVNGISNTMRFTEKNQSDPFENYAISKFNAEIEFQKISGLLAMEVVIRRPSLVYGPDAPGYF